jgi:hypothetical protein
MSKEELIDNELLVERMKKGELDHSFSFSKNKVEFRGIFAWMVYIQLAIFGLSTLIKIVGWVMINLF